MKLTNKNILLISPEPWGINHVSKHHYAMELAKRENNVYFLNPPTKKHNLNRILKNVIVVDYKPTYRGLSKLPPFLSSLLIKKEIEKLERICNANFDVIWNFDSSSFFNLKQLPSKFKISHIVDLTEDKNSKLLSKTADLCLATSTYILKRQLQYNPNAHNIGHGYAKPCSSTPINIPKKTIPIKIGYVGNLLIKYLDWKLIYSLVAENPNISFYFAGPVEKSNLSNSNQKPPFLVKTMNMQNSSFLGSIESTQIALFLKKMDILLLCYKADDYKEQLANPHKMMEYLGSGKMIIATNTQEYKTLANEGLIAMSEQNKSFSQLFNKVVKNIEGWNAKEKTEKRIALAQNNTYDKQIERIYKLIKLF